MKKADLSGALRFGAGAVPTAYARPALGAAKRISGQLPLTPPASMNSIHSLLTSIETALASVATASGMEDPPACVRDLLAGPYPLAAKAAEKLRDYLAGRVSGMDMEWPPLNDGELKAVERTIACSVEVEAAKARSGIPTAAIVVGVVGGAAALIAAFA